MKAIPKAARLEELWRRLRALPNARNFDEAWTQLGRTLDEVEDELSGITNNPSAWATDGRLYPPQLDHEYRFDLRHRVRRFRTVGHNVFIGENGAIQIRLWAPDPLEGKILFSKAGADGIEVMGQ